MTSSFLNEANVWYVKHDHEWKLFFKNMRKQQSYQWTEILIAASFYLDLNDWHIYEKEERICSSIDFRSNLTSLFQIRFPLTLNLTKPDLNQDQVHALHLKTTTKTTTQQKWCWRLYLRFGSVFSVIFPTNNSSSSVNFDIRVRSNF